MSEATKFTLLFSEEERTMLEELATADGRSAANWIRQTIRREHSKLAPTPKKRPKK